MRPSISYHMLQLVHGQNWFAFKLTPWILLHVRWKVRVTARNELNSNFSPLSILNLDAAISPRFFLYVNFFPFVSLVVNRQHTIPVAIFVTIPPLTMLRSNLSLSRNSFSWCAKSVHTTPAKLLIISSFKCVMTSLWSPRCVLAWSIDKLSCSPRVRHGILKFQHPRTLRWLYFEPMPVSPTSRRGNFQFHSVLIWTEDPPIHASSG